LYNRCMSSNANQDGVKDPMKNFTRAVKTIVNVPKGDIKKTK